jgi:hypothetical protein
MQWKERLKGNMCRREDTVTTDLKETGGEGDELDWNGSE